MSSQKSKILVVDDHEFFRRGVILTLNRFENLEVIGEAENGKQCLEFLKHTVPDIILMDIKMPEMDGIETTEQVMKQYPDIKVVALTMFGDEEYLQNMLENGIQGFLLKNIDEDGLKHALDALMSGKQYFSEELLPYFTNKYMGKSDESESQLTKREKEILQKISEGLSNKEIADTLCISIRTVTNHRANINMKTGSKNTASLLAYAIRHNLVKI
jgi:DNA-binding NarL/FixJ family response regulator